jgi:hypothetical protein
VYIIYIMFIIFTFTKAALLTAFTLLTFAPFASTGPVLHLYNKVVSVNMAPRDNLVAHLHFPGQDTTELKLIVSCGFVCSSPFPLSLTVLVDL